MKDKYLKKLVLLFSFLLFVAFSINIIGNTWLYQLGHKYAWVGYAILPLIYAVKFFLVACCLLAGSMFFDVKLKFSEAFVNKLLF